MSLELADGLVATEADRLLQAEALVRSYCRWHIAPSRDETVTLPGNGSGSLLLPSLYVTAVASVTDDGTAVDVADFTWTAAGVLTRLCAWAPRFGSSVVVAFSHGYAEVPPEVTAVVQAVAQRAVDNPGSRVRTQVGAVSESYSQSGSNQSVTLGLLDSEKAILDRYRIPARP